MFECGEIVEVGPGLDRMFHLFPNHLHQQKEVLDYSSLDLQDLVASFLVDRTIFTY